MPNWMAAIEILGGWAVGIGLIGLIIWLRRRKETTAPKAGSPSA